MLYEIECGRLKATINTRGAEATSIRFDGKERSWQNESGAWSGHSPVLFPLCGRTAMRLGEKIYATGFHGLARGREFEAERIDGETVKFTLKSDKETKKIYPFDFTFTVVYSVKGEEYTVEYDVKNDGKEDMFFSVGGHDSFVFDGKFSDYRFEFEKEEVFHSLSHSGKGRLNGKYTDLGKGKTLMMPEKKLRNGKTVIFGDINSRKLSLYDGGGKKVLDMEFDGFSNLLLWRPDESNMVCIEPWGNLPDNTRVKEEFSEKRGVIRLRADETKVLKRKNIYY